MAKAIRLEKYQGDPYGEFETILVVTSENGNFFKTKSMQWTVDEKTNKVKPDFKSTKLTRLSNEHHLGITEQYYCKEIIEKGKHLQRAADSSFQDISNQASEKPKDKGMSM